jgi:MFS transporter, SP family, galactose:H+ symporter
MADERLSSSAVQQESTIRSSLSAVRETPRYTYLIAALAAVGGMLFGYDIGVISGAENLLKSAFRLSSGTEELAVAAVLIGAVVGGVIGGPLANRISRRYTLLAMAILYGIGAILTSLSWDLGSFLAFRILTGIAARPPWSCRPISPSCPRSASAAGW